MENVSVQDIVLATGGVLLSGDDGVMLNKIRLDSRQVETGDLFVPIIGEKVDAHKFLEQVAEKGAGAVLASEHKEKTEEMAETSCAWIAVDDTKKALQAVGRYLRKRLTLPIVGVTGSVGKTTSAAGVTSGAEVKPFTNGKVSFSETIRGGDVIKVTGLPTGAAYTITESGLDAGKYTTAWTLDGETLSTEKTLPTQTVGAADTALTVTNTRSSIAPTGLLLDAAPYGAMLALAAGSGLVFFRKRRRED